MSDDRYLVREGSGWAVRVYRPDGKRVRLGRSYATREEARAARDAYLGGAEWSAVGVTVAEAVDEEAVWRRACALWSETEARHRRRRDQAITLPGQVAGLVCFADEHLGDPGVDYPRFEREARLVAETPGLYAVQVGDLVSNFIKPKMLPLRLQARLAVPDEAVLAKRGLRLLAPKLVATVGGNHEAWTEQLSGLDYFTDVLAAACPQSLYDPDECAFDLRLGDRAWRVKLRHRWRGYSYINPTHGIERSCRHDERFDLGVGAHTHEAGLAREFVVDGRTRLAVLCGSYKRVDAYPRRLGLPAANPSTAVAVLFDARAGSMLAVPDLEEAARLLLRLA